MSVNIKYDFKKFIEDTFASFYTYDPNRSEFADELYGRGLVAVERIGDRYDTIAWKLCFSYDASDYPRKPKACGKRDYIDIIIDGDGVAIMPRLPCQRTNPRPIKDGSWEAANKVAKEIQKRITRYIVKIQEDVQ